MFSFYNYGCLDSFSEIVVPDDYKTKVTVASSIVQYGRNGIFLKAEGIKLNYLLGNIQIDPQFDLSRVSLTNGFPGIDKGNNEYIEGINIAADFNNNKRIVDGNNDGDPIVDIGTHERAILKSPEEDTE